MTLSPGHPLPHLPHLGAVARRRVPPHRRRRRRTSPSSSCRATCRGSSPCPGRPRDRDRASRRCCARNIDLLYPQRAASSGAYLFRVTRAGDLELDEDARRRSARRGRRGHRAATVRIPRCGSRWSAQCRATSPSSCSRTCVARRAARARIARSSVESVQVVERAARPALPRRAARCRDPPALDYPPAADGEPCRRPAHRSWTLVRRRATCSFIIRSIAFDGDRRALPARGGGRSRRDDDQDHPLSRRGSVAGRGRARSTRRARARRVVALVELKARFDEEHNVGWARALERRAAHVVYGLRRAQGPREGRARRAARGRRAPAIRARRHGQLQRALRAAVHGPQPVLRPRVAHGRRRRPVQRAHRLVAAAAGPPARRARRAASAPARPCSTCIERETQHARAGRPAGITIKVNGLSDPEVVRALYRAVGGGGAHRPRRARHLHACGRACPGCRTRIRVVSVVGRFLEHSRIYRFANGARRSTSSARPIFVRATCAGASSCSCRCSTRIIGRAGSRARAVPRGRDRLGARRERAVPPARRRRPGRTGDAVGRAREGGACTRRGRTAEARRARRQFGYSRHRAGTRSASRRMTANPRGRTSRTPGEKMAQ